MARRLLPFLLIAPLFLLMLIWILFPFAYVIIISFFNWQPAAAPELGWRFVGISNFVRAFYDERFINSLLNTGFYVFFCLSLELLLGLAIALILSGEMMGVSVIRVLLTLPFIVSPIVAGFAWRLLFYAQKGPINYILNCMHLQQIPWLTQPPFPLFAVAICDIWQWTPFVALCLLAGISSIPKEMKEAATVDGLTDWQTFRYITLPAITPVMIVVMILRFIDLVKIFDVIFVMTQGGPGTCTESVTGYIYILGFKNFDMGYAAATSLIILIIVMVVAMITVRRFFREG